MKNISLLLWVVGILTLGGCGSSDELQEKYLAKAKTHFDEENYDKMRVELTNVFQINPKNTEARYLSVLLNEKKQNWRKMYASLQMVVEQNPEHIDAQIKLGKLFLWSKDIDKAWEKIELVLAKEPQNADALTLKSSALLFQKKNQQASALLEQVLTTNPGHIDAALLMVRMLGAEKKMDSAMQVLDKVLAVHPDNILLSRVKIDILLAEGKKQEAERLYLSLLEQFPEDQKIHYSLAKFYITENKIEQGKQILIRLVDQLPEEEQPKLVYVDYLISQYSSEVAEAELARIIKENPDNFSFRFAQVKLHKDEPEVIKKILQKIVEDDDPLGASGIDARTRLVALAMSQGKPEEARKLIEKVIELDPRNIKALQFRASFLIKEQNYNAAIADARTILRDEPESEKALMLLSIAQLRSGNNDLAQEALEKILTVNEKNLAATKELASLLIKKKDEAGAFELLEKNHALFKDDVDVSVMLIDMYGRAKNWQKAEAIAKQLLNNAEQSGTGYYKLALLNLAQDKKQQARTYLDQALQADPSHIDAVLLMVRFLGSENKLDKAMQVVNKALATHPGDMKLSVAKISLLMNEEKKTEVEALYLSLLEQFPKDEKIYYSLAKFYIHEKKIKEGKQVLQNLINQLPEREQPKLAYMDYLITQGDSDEAKQEVNKLIKENPDNFNFRFTQLQLYKDHPGVTKKILQQIVTDDPKGVSGIEARNRLAALAISKGELEEARKLTKKTLEIDPVNIKALESRAGLLINEKDYNGAISDVRAILRDQPKSEKALILLAIAQLRNGNKELAQETLEGILKINPKNLAANKYLARVMLMKKENANALALLEKTHQSSKNDVEILVMLIDLYAKGQHWQKAEAMATQLTNQADKSEVGQYKLAQLYLAQNRYSDAAEGFKKVLDIKPVDFYALTGLVNSYLAMDNRVEAEQYLDKKMESNKNNPVLLTLRGELHQQQNQLEKAEQMFQQVIALKPDFAGGYNKLAAVYLQQKSTEKALAMYKKSLAITPDNMIVANNMAALLVNEHEDEASLKQALTLVEKFKDSKHTSLLDTYGWVNLLNGNVNEAQKALESAIKNKDSTPEIHYHLAMVYVKKENENLAKKHLQQAINAKVDFMGLEKAKEALAKL